ncbi:MAG: UvrD-helicase domain-containing protein [candidate division WOR-3 bacterium]|nr:UvrD-helicase domain-containing protein [candidate division WOR-3 bacterium]
MLLKKLGKYEIIEWLGGGRFGDVFLAYDTILEKQFALKIARMRKEEIVMLKDEAKLLASLNHPNIVRFYNIDLIESKFVLVMEYIKGKTLRDVIKEGGIEISEFLNIAQQTLEGINYAHNIGVLHRDLKPENILITEDGIIKITDFGLARFLKTGSIAASTAGTPVYMAPEVWSGKFSDKSDIWSIGVIFYELLTGIPPFLDDNLEGLKKKIEKGKLLIPSMLRANLPEYLEEVIIKCLNVNSELRPDSETLLKILKKPARGIKIETPMPLAEKKKQELKLTPDQEQIINSLDGRLLVLGQAGCGKTTTLVQGILRLIEKGIPPSRILVCTFTNKAANDIRKRLSQSIPAPQYDLWIGTFHTIALRILRRDCERLDICEDFIIEEPKKIFSLLKTETGKYKMNAIIRTIEILKAKGITPEKFAPANEWQKICLKVYKEYQQYLKDNNILDYDDLIIYATKLLEEYEDLRAHYQNMFEYIFVDELQDINPAQYKFISLLVRDNFLFTGDEDQAIYGWRGASKEIIYRVARDFSGVKIFHLNRSFRLPQSILDVANNLMQREATAIPNLETGDVFFYAAESTNEEIDYIVSEIKDLVEQDFSYRDIAILYRMNYLSKSYEEGLSKKGIPFTTIRGASFYEKEEFKEIVEYLEFLSALKSESTSDVSIARGLGIFKTSKTIQKKLEKIVEHHIQNLNVLSPSNIVNDLIQCLKLKSENVEEFLNFSRSYTDTSIGKFLSDLKLYQEMDLADWAKDTVKLMTIHSAKGMEFPVVFVVDLVEEIFPMTKSLSEPRDLEEERRLCYVAVTRAQKRLYLLYPKYRSGRQQLPSRFLIDMLRKR